MKCKANDVTLPSSSFCRCCVRPPWPTPLTNPCVQQGQSHRGFLPPKAARNAAAALHLRPGVSGTFSAPVDTPGATAPHPTQTLSTQPRAYRPTPKHKRRGISGSCAEQTPMQESSSNGSFRGACSLNRVTACNHSQGLGGCMLERLEGRMRSCQPTHTRARKAEGVYRCPWSLWWRWRPSLQRCITTRPVCGPCSHALTSAERR